MLLNEFLREHRKDEEQQTHIATGACRSRLGRQRDSRK